MSAMPNARVLIERPTYATFGSHTCGDSRRVGGLHASARLVQAEHPPRTSTVHQPSMRPGTRGTNIDPRPHARATSKRIIALSGRLQPAVVLALRKAPIIREDPHARMDGRHSPGHNHIHARARRDQLTPCICRSACCSLRCRSPRSGRYRGPRRRGCRSLDGGQPACTSSRCPGPRRPAARRAYRR